MKWYVIHTYSGHENKVKTAIEKGLMGTPLEKQVGRLLVPVRKTFVIREGKKIERDKKLFTSYVIMEADMTPELKTYILQIAGVTSFLGINTLARKHEGKRKIFHKTDRLELASGVKNTEILSPL